MIHDNIIAVHLCTEASELRKKIYIVAVRYLKTTKEDSHPPKDKEINCQIPYSKYCALNYGHNYSDDATVNPYLCDVCEKIYAQHL
uniref:Uncharacterized protein n=1 Tax=Lepeophtheirus salmonis TaxID=72036 RepID=A0A0K2UPP9_LEPSM